MKIKIKDLNLNSIFALIICVFCFSVFGKEYSRSENPYSFNRELISNFHQLPLLGQITSTTKIWPGSHWQNYLGNITYRWSASSDQSFTYSLYSKPQLLTLESHLVDELSPSEKFDLLRGDYDFQMTRSIMSKYSPNTPSWHGICHGMAVAALHHDEPKSVVIKNDDGIEIEFYSSDIKGLLSYYYAYYGNGSYKQIGKRCYRPSRRRSNCLGLNPASFHLILANNNGLNGQSFVVDIDAGNEVWNHLVHSYSSYIVNEAEVDHTSSPKAVRRLRVQTSVTYAGIIIPKFEPVIGTEKESYFQQNYDYYLELDRNNDIIGGEWISDLRPDFVWFKDKSEFSQNWKKLEELLK